jgi:hypothetical protein
MRMLTAAMCNAAIHAAYIGFRIPRYVGRKQKLDRDTHRRPTDSSSYQGAYSIQGRSSLVICLERLLVILILVPGSCMNAII